MTEEPIAVHRDRLNKLGKLRRPGTGLLIAFLLVLMIIVGVGNLWATYAYVSSFKSQLASQQRVATAAGQVVEQKLCTTFGNLAALQPPKGSQGTNPSRAYEQKLHAILAGVSDDINCPPVKTPAATATGASHG